MMRFWQIFVCCFCPPQSSEWSVGGKQSLWRHGAQAHPLPPFTPWHGQITSRFCSSCPSQPPIGQRSHNKQSSTDHPTLYKSSKTIFYPKTFFTLLVHQYLLLTHLSLFASALFCIYFTPLTRVAELENLKKVLVLVFFSEYGSSSSSGSNKRFSSRSGSNKLKSNWYK